MHWSSQRQLNPPRHHGVSQNGEWCFFSGKLPVAHVLNHLLRLHIRLHELDDLLHLDATNEAGASWSRWMSPKWDGDTPPWIHEICGDSTCAHLAVNIVPEIVLLVWDPLSFLHSRHNFNHRVLFRSANVVCTACRFKQLLTIYRRHGNLSKSISVISISQWTPVWPVTPLCSTMSKAAATSSHCWSPITCSVLVSLAPEQWLLQSRICYPKHKLIISTCNCHPLGIHYQIPAFTCK